MIPPKEPSEERKKQQIAVQRAIVTKKESETIPERIYRMRIEGYSPKEIAVVEGIDKSPKEIEAIIISMAERSRLRLLSELSIATIVEIDRMDALTKALWPAASLDGDYGAIDRVMTISKERRKLLGLDAPTISINVKEEDDVDLAGLSTEEVRQFEALQKKLAEARRIRNGPRPATKTLNAKPVRPKPAGSRPVEPSSDPREADEVLPASG